MIYKLLKINEEYWKKNKTWSLDELFDGKIIRIKGAGYGYKYTSFDILVPATAEIVATGYTHAFSMGKGIGGSGGSAPDANMEMNFYDSLEQARKVGSGEFLRYLIENDTIK